MTMASIFNISPSQLCAVCLTIVLVCHNTYVQAAPPIVSDLPVTIPVGELENGERLLKILNIADPNGDSYTCDITIAVTSGTGTPATDPEFRIIQNTLTSNHELWVTNQANFVIATNNINKFEITVTCTDPGGASSIPKTIEIVVRPNEVVTINNVAGQTNDVTVAALSTPMNHLIRTVSATSQQAHDIVFSMSVNPSLAPLDEFFVIDPSTGQIRTNREMQYLDSSTTTVFLTVTAHDNTDSIEVYEYLTVHMTNQNTIPSTANLDTPKKEIKLETIAAASTLISLTTVDPDTTQSHTYTFSCIPTAGDDTFTIDRNGNFKLAVGQTLDHEAINFYNCSFFINDGIHTGGPFVYELTVADDNEAPTFSETMLYATFSEGAKGSQTVTPGFTCTDVDAGDWTYYAFSPANNSERFSIDSLGRITFDVDYDIDNSAMPSTVILTVYCIDTGGPDEPPLTGSTQITITINDVNDNDPTFTSPAYSFVVDQFTQPGAVVGAVTPVDPDAGVSGEVTCAGTSSSTYGPYFSVGQDCNVYLAQTINFPYGTHTAFTTTGTDGGGRTGTTAIDIVYKEATTTTVTTTTAATTTAYNFFDHAENIAMFAMLMLLSLILLGLLAWCLSRICCGLGGKGGGMCKCIGGGNRGKRYPPRHIIPDSPPPEYEPPRMMEKVRVVRSVARPGFMPNGYNGYSGYPDGGANGYSGYSGYPDGGPTGYSGYSDAGQSVLPGTVSGGARPFF